MGTTHDPEYDVAVIGGGSAGLSAALVLARARLDGLEQLGVDVAESAVADEFSERMRDGRVR